MTLWFGVWLSCSAVFDASVDYATIAGPLFNCFILRFVSGVPLLETSADKKWGSSPDYIAYKANTPLLIPKLF
jgi:steroid 5-alpha reductase family enzyme